MPHQSPITLPSQFNGQNLSMVAAAVVGQFQAGQPAAITFNFSHLRFVRPAGVVFLSNLIHWLELQGITVNFEGVSESAAVQFLDDSLFFQQHCGHKLNPSASPRSTTRPLMKIAQDQSHNWLQSDLLPWLSNEMGITEVSLHPYKECLSELFNNIKDHTRFDIGSIFVQHFPNERRVLISLSDFGDGIPATVRTKLSQLSDSEAIIKAVEPGFTSMSTPRNQGIGLDYLLRTVVTANNGIAVIYSSAAIVRFDKRGDKPVHTVLSNVGFCPGTTIDLSIRTDRIPIICEDDDELTSS